MRSKLPSGSFLFDGSYKFSYSRFLFFAVLLPAQVVFGLLGVYFAMAR